MYSLFLYLCCAFLLSLLYYIFVLFTFSFFPPKPFFLCFLSLFISLSLSASLYLGLWMVPSVPPSVWILIRCGCSMYSLSFSLAHCLSLMRFSFSLYFIIYLSIYFFSRPLFFLCLFTPSLLPLSLSLLPLPGSLDDSFCPSGRLDPLSGVVVPCTHCLSLSLSLAYCLSCVSLFYHCLSLSCISLFFFLRFSFSLLCVSFFSSILSPSLTHCLSLMHFSFFLYIIIYLSIYFLFSPPPPLSLFLSLSPSLYLGFWMVPSVPPSVWILYPAGVVVQCTHCLSLSLTVSLSCIPFFSSIL